MNTCDKCGIEINTNDLIWLTSEDFEPKIHEVVPDWVFDRYDALCEKCYFELIKVRA